MTKKSACRAILPFILCVVLLSHPVAGGEVTLRVASPDVVLDSMRQDITYHTELGACCDLAVAAGQRYVRDGGWSGVDQAYVSGTWPLPGGEAELSVLVGRAGVDWSLWNGDSVVLSADAPGWDQLQYTYSSYPVKVDKVVGRLSGDDRYLLAHRLTLQHGNFTGTIGETVVCTGAFAGNLVSLLPWPYYWTQWVGLASRFTDNDDVNVFAFVQGLYAQPDGWELGAELMVDDMPDWFDEKGQIFQLAVQLHAGVPLGGGRLDLDYTRVNNFTYSFQDPIGNYINHGYVLGFPQGPDADELKLSFSFPRSLLGINAAGLTIRRHGTGRMGDTWEHRGVAYGLEHQFLAGVVESSQQIWVAGEYPLWQGANMTVRFGVGPHQNVGNLLGYNKVAPSGNIGIHLQF